MLSFRAKIIVAFWVPIGGAALTCPSVIRTLAKGCSLETLQESVRQCFRFLWNASNLSGSASNFCGMLQICQAVLRISVECFKSVRQCFRFLWNASDMSGNASNLPGNTSNFCEGMLQICHARLQTPGNASNLYLGNALQTNANYKKETLLLILASYWLGLSYYECQARASRTPTPQLSSIRLVTERVMTTVSCLKVTRTGREEVCLYHHCNL